MQRRTLAAAAAMLGTAAAFLDTAHAAPPADIDAYVAQSMQTFGAPGLSLSIVEGGRATLTKGYGVRRLASSGVVDEHTAFPIGSETKAFTAAALAILVDRKKLSWDDHVADRLSGFQMYDPYVTAHMTIRDLLTHRSGLSLGEGDLLVIPDTNRSRDDVVHALRYLRPATGFREQFAYDNILYIVAGRLVEEVSGEPWEKFVSDNIFKPAGMADAHADYDADQPNEVALHGRVGGRIRGVGNQSVLPQALAHTVAPAGGVNLSATDMATWMNILLSHGRLPNGGRLFSEEQAAELFKPVVVVPPEEFALPTSLSLMQPELQTYALGWFVEDYRGHFIIEHSGAVFGALAMLYLIPDKQVGLAVSINSEDSPARRAVTFHLLDHYLGFQPTDWIGKLKQARAQSIAEAEAVLNATPSPARTTSVAQHLPLEQYAGTYTDPWYGNMTVTMPQAGKFRISFDRTPGMQGALEPLGGDRFRTRWDDHNFEDAYVDFHPKTNNIDSVTLKAISPLADFSFDYQDLHFVRASSPAHSPVQQ